MRKGSFGARTLAVLLSAALEATGAGGLAWGQTLSAPVAPETLAVASPLPTAAGLAPLSTLDARALAAPQLAASLRPLSALPASRSLPVTRQLQVSPPPLRGRIEVGGAISASSSLRDAVHSSAGTHAEPALRMSFDGSARPSASLAVPSFDPLPTLTPRPFSRGLAANEQDPTRRLAPQGAPRRPIYKRRWFQLTMAGVLLAAALATGGWWFFGRTPHLRPIPEKPPVSIVVQRHLLVRDGFYTDADGSLSLVGHPAVQSEAFGPDGTLLTTGPEGSIKLWKLDKREVFTVMSPVERPQEAVLSKDGRQAVILGRDGSVSVLDFDKNTVDVRKPPEGELILSRLSRDGSGAVLVYKDGTVRMWDLVNNKLQVFKAEAGSVQAAGMTSEGPMIASLRGGNVTVWLVPFGGEPQVKFTKFIGGAVTMYSVEVSDDGKLVAAAGQVGTDKAVIIIDLAADQFKILTLDALTEEPMKVTRIAFIPGSPRLLIQGSTGQVWVWQYPRMRNAKVADGTTGPIAASPDAKRAAAAQADGTIKIVPLPPKP